MAGGRAARLHELRIAVKRLRYNLEFLAAIDRTAAAPALACLALLQERLGAVADADSFARTYAAMLEPLGPDDPRRPGLERLAAAARSEREAVLEAARALWRGDGARGYPDTLAASISAALGSLSPNESG